MRSPIVYSPRRWSGDQGQIGAIFAGALLGCRGEGSTSNWGVGRLARDSDLSQVLGPLFARGPAAFTRHFFEDPSGFWLVLVFRWASPRWYRSNGSRNANRSSGATCSREQPPLLIMYSHFEASDSARPTVQRRAEL